MAASTNFGRTYISFDWALKRLLRNKANFVILEGFLSELLKQDIHINQLLESEANAEAEDDKINRVDLLCENDKQELFIIELQYHSEMDYFQRMLFGCSQLITAYLHQGEAYEKVRKVYSVNILYFDLGQGQDYIYHGTLQFKGVHQGDELRLNKLQRAKFKRDLAGSLYPEYYLLKINNFDEVARDSLDEWVYYLKTSRLPADFRAKGLKEVEKQLKIDAMAPEQKAKYLKYMKALKISESMLETAFAEGADDGFSKGIEKGIEKGKVQGIEQGKREKIKEAVLAAYQRKLAVGLIAAVLNLQEEEVKVILQENGYEL